MSFAFGGEFCPELLQELVPFLLVDIVERRAERPHSVIKSKKGYRRAGPIKVSSSLRLPEIEHRIDNVPGFCKD